MKFLCPHCERLLELEQFKLDGATLVVTCGKCGAESRSTALPLDVAKAASAPAAGASTPPELRPPRISLASSEGTSNVVMLRTSSHDAVARAAAATATPFASPEGLCPKCLARRRPDAPDCPHCGVRFELFDESSVLPPKLLRDEWVALLNDWGNEARHQTFRRQAQQLDALPAVGRLYRVRQSNFPEDPFAAEALSDILRLAAVPIGTRGKEADDADGSRRLVTAVMLVVAFILLGLVFALLWRG